MSTCTGYPNDTNDGDTGDTGTPETANTIEGGWEPINNHFNIIKDNHYIKGITLPSTLTSIGGAAFFHCSALTTVIFGTGSTITTAWNNNAFSSSSSSDTYSGVSLWAAYTAANKPGTYTRDDLTWKQSS